jgi:V/A-type H+-transporting ATPase subunit I
MFGDAGHGLVLAIIGGILKFKIKANQVIKRFGGMLLACGIFSMFAGLLYGSVFGIEELFHPLLGKPPLENVTFLIKFSLYLGVALLALGCILNIINKLYHHEPLVAIFNPWGVMGLWLLLGGTYLVTKNNADIFKIKSDMLVFPLVIFPLLAIMFGMIYAEKISIGWGFYEAFEAATRFLFNTISYVRAAVIGVVHAALCLLMVMAIKMMPSSAIGYIGKAIIFILGNVTIIAFEGLISFIQTLRLYYSSRGQLFFRIL